MGCGLWCQSPYLVRTLISLGGLAGVQSEAMAEFIQIHKNRHKKAQKERLSTYTENGVGKGVRMETQVRGLRLRWG